MSIDTNGKTPPVAASAPTAPDPTSQAYGRRASGQSRVVAGLTIALGCVIVLVTLGSATFSTIAAAGVHTETQTIDTAGVTELTVEANVATMRIGFADVSQATLEVTTGGSGEWTMERTGRELRVQSPRGFGGGWFLDDTELATLTLPRELEGPALDANLDLSAGELTVDGEFGALDIGVGAGAATVTGSARTLNVNVSAGGAEILLDDVQQAQFSVSAGAIDSRLTGVAPQLVTVDVSAGSLNLALPDVTYDVRSDVLAGDFVNRLTTEGGSANVVDVMVSAGSVIINSGR